jgi:hypothetical protein
MVKLWSREGEKIEPFNLFPVNEKFNNLEFSPDSKLIATYSGARRQPNCQTLEA